MQPKPRKPREDGVHHKWTSEDEEKLKFGALMFNKDWAKVVSSQFSDDPEITASKCQQHWGKMPGLSKISSCLTFQKVLPKQLKRLYMPNTSKNPNQPQGKNVALLKMLKTVKKRVKMTSKCLLLSLQQRMKVYRCLDWLIALISYGQN